VDLSRLLDALEAVYGLPRPPPTSDPFELVVWENIAYLADDATRAVAFATLRERVGTQPSQILSAPWDVLLQVGGAGRLPASSAGKLRTAAAIAVDRFGGDLGQLGQLPLPAARQVLKAFPSIGEPGADKILLLAQLRPVLALDSNGLRVLVRSGYGREARSYSATYRSVLAAVQPELAHKTFDWLIRAHLLLRRHGQEVCRRNSPACHVCPLTATCAYYRLSR
jgi:endonuclease-3